ncbi:MAG: hypothetical protein ACI8XQ_001860 [Bermanella sp.]
MDREAVTKGMAGNIDRRPPTLSTKSWICRFTVWRAIVNIRSSFLKCVALKARIANTMAPYDLSHSTTEFEFADELCLDGEGLQHIYSPLRAKLQNHKLPAPWYFCTYIKQYWLLLSALPRLPDIAISSAFNNTEEKIVCWIQ